MEQNAIIGPGKEKFNCRFYENKYPEVDDLVMVNVRQIAEMGAYVHLLEYDNIEGMVLLSELSRRRIRSVQKLIRVGRNEVVVVLRVDKEKGYIDLSKRRVSTEDIQKCEEKFNKSKLVHTIIRNVAEKNNASTEHLYQTIVWPLYRKYGHAYDAFKLSISEPESVFSDTRMTLEVKKDILTNIQRRLIPQKVKIRADIEVFCYGYDGIDAVKASLKAGEQQGNEEMPLKIKLVAPPLYVIFTHCLDKAAGIELVTKAIQAVGDIIKTYQGSLNVKVKPKAVSDLDDMELENLMRQAELENAEVSGDEDSSEADDNA